MLCMYAITLVASWLISQAFKMLIQFKCRQVRIITDNVCINGPIFLCILL